MRRRINQLGRLFHWGLDWTARYPYFVIAFMMLPVVARFAWTGGPKLGISSYDSLQPGSVAFRNQQEADRNFSATHNLAVVVESRKNQPLTTAQLCTIQDWIDSTKKNNPAVFTIQSPFEMRRIEVKSSGELDIPKLIPDLDCRDPEAPTLSAFKELLEHPTAPVFIGKNAQSLALVLNIIPDFSDPLKPAINVAAIDEVRQSTVLLKRYGQVEVHLSGPAYFRYHQHAAMTNRQIIILSILAVLLFWIAYGSVRGGVLMLVPLGVTMCAVDALMALAGHSLEVLTFALPTIFGLSCAADYLQIVDLQRKTNLPLYAVKRVALPSFFTSLTTIVGFSSLYLSDVDSIQRFGMWAATGALIEWFVTMFGITAIQSAIPFFRNLVSEKERRIDALFSLIAAGQFPKYLSVGLVAAVIVVPFGLANMQANDSYLLTFPDGHDFLKHHEETVATMNWASGIDLIVRNSIPKDTRAQLVEALKSDPEVAVVEDPFPLIDSGLASLQPEESQRIIDLIKNNQLYSRYYGRDDLKRIFVYTRSDSSQSKQRLSELVRNICPEHCFFAGDLYNSTIGVSELIPTVVESSLVSIVVVALFLYFLTLAYRSNEKAAIIISSLWGPIVMMGVMALWFGDLTIADAVFYATLSGLTADNSIHYLLVSKSRGFRQGLQAKQEASLKTYVFLGGIAFSFLAFEMRHIHHLLTLFLVGYAFLAVGDIWLLRSMLDWWGNSSVAQPLLQVMETGRETSEDIKDAVA